MSNISNDTVEKKEETGSVFESDQHDAKTAGFEADMRNAEAGDIVKEISAVSSESHETDDQHKREARATREKSSQKSVVTQKVVTALPFPKPHIMVRKIRTTVRHEIHQLRKTILHLSRNATHNAFELSVAVEQLRQLLFFFSDIVHKTFAVLKNIWIAISQGKKVIEVVF